MYSGYLPFILGEELLCIYRELLPYLERRNCRTDSAVYQVSIDALWFARPVQPLPDPPPPSLRRFSSSLLQAPSPDSRTTPSPISPPHEYLQSTCLFIQHLLSIFQYTYKIYQNNKVKLTKRRHQKAHTISALKLTKRMSWSH
jgi:hypothetical protein